MLKGCHIPWPCGKSLKDFILVMIHLTIPKIDGGGYERVAARNTQCLVD